MDPLNTSLIIIHFLKEANDFDFENTFANQIRSVLPTSTNFLEMDNFSDAITLNYASELVISKNLTIILQGEEEALLGKAASILNQTIRHPHLKLLALNEIQATKPYMTRHVGKVISESELLAIIATG